jgi:hypothetical protein
MHRNGQNHQGSQNDDIWSYLKFPLYEMSALEMPDQSDCHGRSASASASERRYFLVPRLILDYGTAVISYDANGDGFDEDHAEHVFKNESDGTWSVSYEFPTDRSEAEPTVSNTGCWIELDWIGLDFEA